MKGREWQPGDVARVTYSGVDQIALVRPRQEALGERLEFAYVSRGYDMVDDPDVSGSARPLVAIDPEDREQVERLVNLVDDCFNDVRVDGTGPTAVDLAQIRLREFVTPKPDEPKSYLAVIQVADGRRYWRWSAGDAHTGWPWRLLGAVHADTEHDGNFRWDDLAVVEVVSEGVEVPS